MVFADIEKLKSDYTDKYVVVDAERPELARFRDVVGQVKTVNMSGRALVEFLDYHLNIGWYDIDLNFLKVVDKPPPKATKPATKKPAAKAEAKPAAKPPAKAAAVKAGGKPSTADVLAAARRGAAPDAKPAEPTKPTGGKKMSTADVLAAARGGAGAAPAKAETEPSEPKQPPAKEAAPAKPTKVDRSKMSVADVLAAARGQGAPGAAPAAEPQAEAPPAEQSEEPAAAAVGNESSASQVDDGASEVPEAPVTKTIEKVDRTKMSVDEKIAWCREHDAE